MRERMTIRRVTPEDLLDIFFRRCRSIFLAAALVVAAFFVFQQMTFVPRYSATATLYLLRQEQREYRAPEEFSLALSVVNDCAYLLKSHAVLGQAAEELGLVQSYDTLRSCISIENPSGTRILEVTVEAETAEQAKQIADRVCEIGAEKIGSAMHSDLVQLYEYGVIQTEPCNRIGPLAYVLLGAASAVLIYFKFLLSFFLKGV